jgi:hypothetical protein
VLERPKENFDGGVSPQLPFRFILGVIPEFGMMGHMDRAVLLVVALLSLLHYDPV